MDHASGLIRVRATGRIEITDMEAHFRDLEVLARDTTGPVAAVIDARGVVLRELRGVHRDCAVSALKRMRPLIRERYVAQAFVLDSIVGRAMVGMLHLFVKPALRTRSFANVDRALDWARAELANAES